MKTVKKMMIYKTTNSSSNKI